jgi:exopolysaccharide biosynthesis WecB/TagA/CpsF family protein
MHADGRKHDWPTIQLAGLPIVRAGMEDSADDFIHRAQQTRTEADKPFYSTSANGQVIAQCQQDTKFEKAIREADQIHADGMSLVIFSKWFMQTALTERVATTDLVHAVAERAEKTGVRFYFLGGSQEVNDLAVANMRERYPQLIFAGQRNGYFTKDEEEAIVQDIVASKTDILWLGFGIPLEQQFVSRNIDKLNGVAVIKTCGGLFDFIAGKNKRAPQWMQDMGLEWAHRMMMDPKRLGIRYLMTNPVALYVMFKNLYAEPQIPDLRNSKKPVASPYRISEPKTK